MEYSFSSKEKGINYWASASVQSDIPTAVDGDARNPPEDPFGNISDMMTVDGYAGWCGSPSATEHLLASHGFSSLMSLPPNYASFDQLNFSEQSNNVFPMSDGGSSFNLLGSQLGFVDKMASQHSDMQFGHPVGPADENDSDSKQDSISLLLQGKIPRPIGHSLAERMLRALSLFKESSGGGILAQMWVPIRDGDHYILSTCEQPFLLDQMLLGYREVSRSYTFSIEQKPGSFPGLPGRVFISKIPEWTSNVSYYNSAEYLRVKHALDHEVRGSVAIPIFSPADMSCCAVLELVTVREKPNFDSEMEAVCRALEAVDLRTTATPRLLPQLLSLNQRTALAEITDVLRAVCHAHRLPLALTWIPCTLEEDGEKIIRIQARESNSNLNKKPVLCIEETACYVNDKEMQGFVRACAEHPLEEGQGVAGKALQSNIPFFSSDVKNYHINEYPLVQHARKFQLNAAVAIRLRSINTGSNDYILEFFLPINMKGTKEQQLLLDSLSGTMQRICQSLRTVADAELDGSVNSEVKLCRSSQSCFPRDVPMMNSQPLASGRESSGISRMSLDVSVAKKGSLETDGSCEQASGPRKPQEKKRSTAEKTVSLSVLQQYFSGSLKDAAKSLGVCPTTLKRICRQHGISRWPSRKINKVNRSLKKIQTVLDSVEGVEGGLKFDPATGELVAASSVIQEFDAQKSVFLPSKNTAPENLEATKQNQASFPASPCLNAKVPAVKLEKDSYVTGDVLRPFDSDSKEQKKSDILSEHIGYTRKSTLGGSPFHRWSASRVSSELGNSYPPFLSQPSHSKVALDEMDIRMENHCGAIEHNQHCSSSMTDSSNASGSFSRSPSPNSGDNWRESKGKTNIDDTGSRITIKASYREDTIRFKFEPSAGCLHLYEEVAKRFKLALGTFQLKYLDDEEEWVLLVSDSDLHECLEIMEFVGKQSVKFLVRDMPCGVGSSGSSNCFLTGSS